MSSCADCRDLTSLCLRLCIGVQVRAASGPAIACLISWAGHVRRDSLGGSAFINHVNGAACLHSQQCCCSSARGIGGLRNWPCHSARGERPSCLLPFAVRNVSGGSKLAEQEAPADELYAAAAVLLAKWRARAAAMAAAAAGAAGVVLLVVLLLLLLVVVVQE